MARDGSGVYAYPDGTEGASGETIESEAYNAFLLDIQGEQNAVRPILYGGTGASTAADARTALGVMPITGGTVTGDITINKAEPLIQLKKTAAGQAAWLGASTGELDRWWIAFGDATPEAGGNAGSNFSLTRWNDAGGQIAEALNINRATGAWTVGGAVTINGAVTISGATTIAGNTVVNGDVTVARAANEGVVFLGSNGSHYLHWTGTQYYLAAGLLSVDGAIAAPSVSIGGNGTFGSLNAGTTVLGSTTTGTLTSSGTISGASLSCSGAMSVGTNLTVSGTISCGQITPTSVSAAGNITGGSFTTGGAATVSGTLTASHVSIPGAGSLTVGGAATVGGLMYCINNLSVEGPNIHVGTALTGGKILFGTGGHNLNFNVTNSDGWRFQGGGGGLHIDYDAIKPGGGPWSAPSDGRIKTLLGKYEHGLEQITRLKPQRFKYKDKDFDLVKDREYIGLVAQDVEPVMPEMVSKKKGHIDGKEVKDLRMTDTTALIYALVNACRELAERVEQLEGNGTAKRKR